MIREKSGCFILDTKNTTYCFNVMETGHLEHLYYGRLISIVEALPMMEKHQFAPGNTSTYDSEHGTFSLEDACLEMSSYGKGDIREPFIEVVHDDGGFTSDFLYDSYMILDGGPKLKTLPCSYDDKGQVEGLIITLKDKWYNLTLELSYYVYEECDVITRCARLINDSGKSVSIKRILSTQLDFDTPEYIFSTFNGSWGREMERYDTRINAGKHVNASYAGVSSNRANPFVMLSKETTSEDFGDCYGINLVYSGNHYEAVEVNGYGKTRFVSGINPQSFSYMLEPGECFEAPEAVMTYSHEGFNGMSQHMHQFVREHIVRGQWKYKDRPVLLNSWEASYFDINERKLLKLAKAGKEVGIELFVMDDGWFGTRDNDAQSLGDWTVNDKKLPNGLDGLCKKIKSLGLEFGIWVEPEMVNVNSKLYEEHPDWVLQIPGKCHSEGRNQRVLDLTKPQVREYIIESMKKVFSSADISYVKWDMNRIFSDVYSDGLSPDRQGEVFHRYVIGLYEVMQTLTEAFPNILFEGCAAGGNRFDLGILCYFPQIWASDNTDAVSRANIQTGYSYGYPMSTVSAHVSACPNHQTLRTTPLESRFNTASFGVLGYECNLCDMKKEDVAAIKAQIELYKNWRHDMQFGSFYRGRGYSNGTYGNITEWTCVSQDKKKAVGYVAQKLVSPNTQYEYYKAKGLDADRKYHFYNRFLKYNVKNFGDLVNTVAPIHVKQDSLVHDIIAKFVKLDGETEDYTLSGGMLMYSGVKLKQSFGGTGYNEQVRYFQDFCSRIYFMEQE